MAVERILLYKNYYTINKQNNEHNNAFVTGMEDSEQIASQNRLTYKNATTK